MHTPCSLGVLRSHLLAFPCPPRAFALENSVVKYQGPLVCSPPRLLVSASLAWRFAPVRVMRTMGPLVLFSLLAPLCSSAGSQESLGGTGGTGLEPLPATPPWPPTLSQEDAAGPSRAQSRWAVGWCAPRSAPAALRSEGSVRGVHLGVLRVTPPSVSGYEVVGRYWLTLVCSG